MSFENICYGIARKEGWCIKDDLTENITGDIARTMWFTSSDHQRVTAVAFVYAYEPVSTEEMFEKLCEAYMKKKKISSVEELELKLVVDGFLR